MLKINIILGSSGNELIKGKMERLSKLVCENIIACPEFNSGSGLWEGLWERIIMEERRSQRVEKSNGRSVEDMK